ncbi:hypothetical protein VNO78_03342 [Psophocarpus tetragonolobus]|uniref:C3H1-type domain-containing protein n=1 Tax=Psophocarpus tetragonolobus TaxID=3891 RepID=A0AAN9XWV2_PSOTE
MDTKAARIKASMCVSRAPKKSSSSICKYWANGKCMLGEHCRHLHSWSDGILIRFHEHNPKPMRLVWWTAPPQDFVKINCDGAFSSFHGNKASAGGVVRDWKGKFVIGFSTLLNKCDTVIEAELLAIKIGIQETISMGFKKLVIESDSYTAVQLINQGVQTSHPYHALVSSILHIVSMADLFCCNHVFREINSVADGFAKHGLSLPPRFGVQLFRCPPPFSSSSLCADKAGLIYSR